MRVSGISARKSRTIKTAYFVDAPYQVDKISEQTFADWQQKAANIALSLPELNPYIPDDFSLIKSEKKYDHPELIVDESNLRVVYAPSRYFFQRTQS